MFRKTILATIFVLLAYGFWLSPELKEITAGVAIFLFGMLFLEEGFKAFTGGLLEKLLRKTTDRLWKSLSFGVISTTLMQSSSLVSVITISFLSAGLITLASGIGIIFGANLGTTTGAWLVAGLGLKVNISAYAMPMLAFGIILVFQKPRELKGIGYVLAGVGFLFLGIHYMKEGFDAFRDTINLADYAVSGYPGLLLYTLIGIVATVIMQSSHATLVLIITALASQQVNYENALALAIGSNIGTTITAILGALGANINGRRLAGAHLIFNLVTGLVAIGFIYQLTDLVDYIAARLGIAADDYTLKLAVFHTLFNLIGIVLMLPFTNRLVGLLHKLLPEQEHQVAEPRYLHDAAIELPDTALEAVRKETLNLFSYFMGVVCHGLNLRIRDMRSARPVEEIIASDSIPRAINIEEEYTSKVKNLYAQIVGFTSLAQVNMSQEQYNALFELRSAGRDMLEAIKSAKHLHKNLSRHMHSPNPYVREEYSRIRYRLALILRRLYDLQQSGDDEEGSKLLSLELLRREMDEANNNVFRRLDTLIREKHISGVMATSLMNDHTYATGIADNLLDIGYILFKSRDITLHEVEQTLSLTEQEIIEALAARNPAGKERES